MRALLAKPAVVCLQKDDERIVCPMRVCLETALPSKSLKMSHGGRELPSTPHWQTNIPPNKHHKHHLHYWVMDSERSVALLRIYYEFRRSMACTHLGSVSYLFDIVVCVCLVSPVKLKYILSEGCKLLRLAEGLEEWTQSSCYITSTEDG